jgi:hypothetical protein
VRLGYLKFGLISVLLAFVMIFSIVLIVPSVSAGGVTSTPGGKTIVVTPGQEFLLRQELYFNDPTAGGVFAMAIFWDALSSDENFVLENAPSIYWISGPETGSPVENVQLVSDNSENVVTVGLYIDASDKNYIDGHFNVDIWLRASSGDGTLHSLGKQQLSYGAGIAVTESTLAFATVDNVTIDVRQTLPPSEHKGSPLIPVAIAVAMIVIVIIAILAAWMWRRPKG